MPVSLSLKRRLDSIYGFCYGLHTMVCVAGLWRFLRFDSLNRGLLRLLGLGSLIESVKSRLSASWQRKLLDLQPWRVGPSVYLQIHISGLKAKCYSIYFLILDVTPLKEEAVLKKKYGATNPVSFAGPPIYRNSLLEQLLMESGVLCRLDQDNLDEKCEILRGH
nr:nuclear poly(A) polymerase 4-like isoform X2 [Tanacetum cinerariifolium]GEW78265.1 nuclear poly(A) polymerase 4-like isoform X2 [Tanacetum cinerariifolium]